MTRRSREGPRDIIVAPVVSEKSYASSSRRLHVRRRPAATKPEIHDAVEAIWGVTVLKVNTLNRQGQDPAHRRTNREAAVPTPSGPSSPSPRATTSSCSRAEGTSHGHPHPQATSAGRRFQTVSDFAEITKSTPERACSHPRPARRPQLRGPHDRPSPRRRPQAPVPLVDFKRTKDGVGARVAAVEYDPNRTCRIALLHYEDGEKAYILARAT
jgi:ribosomal protein L23